MTLQARAAHLAARGIFLGGPERDFETAGRLQLIALLRGGVFPHSKVVDIGCGRLRGGYWLIHFLDPGCYFGIEPATRALEGGVNELLEPEVREQRRPRFDTNATFDTSVFGERFDFFLARSIWTHASKEQIGSMLDAFQRDAAPGGVFLTSYLPAGASPPGARASRRFWRKFRRRLGRLRPRPGDRIHPRDYQGAEWSAALIRHSFEWVDEECRRRGVSVVELPDDRFNEQVWLRITRAGAPPNGTR